MPIFDPHLSNQIDMNHSGCLVCGGVIAYRETEQPMDCYFCGGRFESMAHCIEEHFVCDDCHTKPAEGIITKLCVQNSGIDPIALADKIMQHEAIKMHGPEHHFMVPAVLLACYYTQLEQVEKIPAALEKARQRASHVPGSFCGTNGACGAGIGTGVFLSVATQATPLSTDSWRYANATTAKSLLSIAQMGGPRCCKRDSYSALQTGISAAQEYLSVELESSEPQCGIFHNNKECTETACPYYPKI